MPQMGDDWPRRLDARPPAQYLPGEQDFLGQVCVVSLNSRLESNEEDREVCVASVGVKRV